MEVERKRSKGGFFQLFDWHGKSRKKLFTSDSELSGSKQGKENVKNSAEQHHFLEADNGVSSSNRGSSDYNYASSVASDEGYGTRAPGVVARLMGLDSLPTSNVPEPCATPFSDYHSLRAGPYESCAPSLGSEYSMEYINFPNKLQSFSSNPDESRLHKVQNRPIERFQTEILPPKSAKSIPSTHHKLLSPIKGPGFTPTRNAAYIMEAAAKIIEASPQVATTGKVSFIGSSSVPLRIRDLKEKMEAAQKAPRPQRQKEPSAVRYTKGQSGDKSCSVSEHVTAKRGSINSETSNLESSKNKGKSVSQAAQAKVNIRRKEGPSSSSNRGLINQRDHDEVKSNQNFKSQSSLHKSTQQKRTSSGGTSNVLRQNSLKQNCASSKDRLASKTSSSIQPRKKTIPTNGAVGPSRTVNKVFINAEAGSRTMESVEAATVKEPTPFKTKSFPRKQGTTKRDSHVQDSVEDRALMSVDKRSIKCSVALDGCKNWDADGKDKGMDVVSFTFTSPLTRSIHEPQSSGLMMEKINGFAIDSFGDSDQSYSNHSTSSSPRLNLIGSDALSLLLDQKLRELTHRVEFSHSKSGTSSSSSSMQDSLSTITVINSTSSEHEKKFLLGLRGDQPDGLYGCDSPSINDSVIGVDEKWQGHVGLEECSTSSNYSESGKELAYRHRISISNFESSFGCGSDMEKRNRDNGRSSKNCILVHSQEASSSISTTQSLTVEGDTELSDSASSIYTGEDMERKKLTTFSSTQAKRPKNWELEYLKNVLNAELRLKDFLLGEADNVIAPSLFDHLENQQMGRNGDEQNKLQRRVFFDCIVECLDSRCKQLVFGNHKACATWRLLVDEKGLLAEQLYKEISGLRSMGDLMVDELVDKDMSTQNGRWLEFEIEAFEESVEIEKTILSSLVDELVTDLMI